MKQSEVYEIITARIIALLQSGTVPWQKPWKTQAQAPQSLVTKRPYRGINVFLLTSACFASPFWLTRKQLAQLGGIIKEGERPFPVVFWKWLEPEDEERRKKIPCLRLYSVFNLMQVDGEATQIENDPPPAISSAEEQAETVIEEMPNPPTIKSDASCAIYSPERDEVRVPPPAFFERRAQYYTTLFHELIHATGHPSRLNRRAVAEMARFGSDPYGKEELVAEMGASFLAGYCGISDDTVAASSSYIQTWLEKIQSDHRLVVQAAAQAQKAADYVLGMTPVEKDSNKMCETA